MDTITPDVMSAASDEVLGCTMAGITVHTVTITLNGQHGGADCIIAGLYARPGQRFLQDFAVSKVLR